MSRPALSGPAELFDADDLREMTTALDALLEEVLALGLLSRIPPQEVRQALQTLIIELQRGHHYSAPELKTMALHVVEGV